jgi:hypothetical protein
MWRKGDLREISLLSQLQSPKAPRELLDIEVHEQRNPQAGAAQVGQRLRLVNRKEPLDGLDLHDDEALHDEVDAVR